MQLSKDRRVASQCVGGSRELALAAREEPRHLTADQRPIPSRPHVDVGGLDREVILVRSGLHRGLQLLIAEHVAKSQADAATDETSDTAAASRQVRFDGSL